MPELPEVETIAIGLQKIHNYSIENIVIRINKLRYTIDSNSISEFAINARITHVYRHAKYIVMKLSNSYCLVIHLGMSGSLSLNSIDDNSDQTRVPKKHDHIDLILTQNQKKYLLIYNDPRRFGNFFITNQKDLLIHHLFKNLGVEPLSNKFNFIYFKEKILLKNTPIKKLIMDNHIVVGVGNIYASEALFKAKISPLRVAKTLSDSEITLLLKTIKETLLVAIAKGGSTLRDYKNINGASGNFQNEHLVYQRSSLACYVCSDIILNIVIGQRNSFYCPSCQS